MIQLAQSSGTVMYEHENKVYLIKKPAAWTATFLFVTGLLALILLANACLQLFVLTSPSHLTPTPGLILLALGILFAFIFWKTTAYRKKLKSKPLHELECICILDFVNHNLLDGQQNILASLDHVNLSRSMQMTSSSPRLQLTWNKNIITIVEGNPFSGGVEAIEKALILKGIKRK